MSKEAFINKYTEVLTLGYRTVGADHSPRSLATKMTEGLIAGTANKDSESIKAVCKHFKIKHTYKAIKEFCSLPAALEKPETSAELAPSAETKPNLWSPEMIAAQRKLNDLAVRETFDGPTLQTRIAEIFEENELTDIIESLEKHVKAAGKADKGTLEWLKRYYDSDDHAFVSHDLVEDLKDLLNETDKITDELFQLKTKHDLEDSALDCLNLFDAFLEDAAELKKRFAS